MPYYSYNGGHCLLPSCNKELGLIEVDGGRYRQYCSEACRVAAFRQRAKEKKRVQVRQDNYTLIERWHQANFPDDVVHELEDVLVFHGREAAERATNAVLLTIRSLRSVKIR